MIAIAGAKGGCGKTVVTAGLTEAIARRERSALAVDADRQLPTLHLVGDVDREPTLAAFEQSEDVVEVAHQSPREDHAGYITAPATAEQLDIEATLGRIDTQPVELFVDSPSGAGPDVVEPLAAADRVVIVTTGSSRSIEGAKTTIDLADRLHVSVAGILVNKAESVPDEVYDQLNVPVLGTVPEVEDPLTDERARAAFDDIAAELAAQHPNNYEGERRLSTGVDPVDETLDGGVLPGSVVAVRADPDSQSELLLYQLTNERGTLYLTTGRAESIVRDAIDNAVVETGSPTIRRVDDADPIGQATSFVDRLPEAANLIVDPIGLLEQADRSEYTEFLNMLVTKAQETESAVFLHCLEGPALPSNRSTTEHFADMVFRLETAEDGATQQLSIPKSRSERAPESVIDIDLTGELGVGY